MGSASDAVDGPIGLVRTSGLASGSEFPIGTTNQEFTATDSNDNTNTCTFTVTVTDNEAPTVSCPSDISADTDNGSNKAVVSWSDATAGDNDAVADLSADQNSGSAFGIGLTTVTYTATDHAGLTASCTFTITVSDNEDPVITCPSNINRNTDADSDKAVVSWAVPSPTDNDGIASTGSDKNPGASFAVGPTQVTYTTTDNSGNSASCSFTVTVTDNQAPEFTSCPANIVQSESVASWDDPVAVENTDTLQITQSHESGSEFPLGTTTVQYQA